MKSVAEFLYIKRFSQRPGPFEKTWAQSQSDIRMDQMKERNNDRDRERRKYKGERNVKKRSEEKDKESSKNNRCKQIIGIKQAKYGSLSK